MAKTDKRQRVREIRELLQSYTDLHMDDETAGFVLELLAMLNRKKRLDLTRGRKEIWAAAIVSVIARLNFLFDPELERPLSPSQISEFFKCNRNTVANKATGIERACELAMPEPRLCRQEIVDALTCVESPGGLILTALNGLEIVCEFLEGEEAEELERQIAEEERLLEREAEEKRARQAEANRRIAEDKKRAKRERLREVQPALFDF